MPALLLFQGTYYPAASGSPLPQTTVYGRLVTPDGKPSAQTQLTLSADSTGAPLGNSLALCQLPVRTYTASDGSFAFPVANTAALCGFQVGCHLTGQGVDYRFRIIPGYAYSLLVGGDGYAPVGAPLPAPPSWGAVTTCTVSGTVGAPNGGAAGNLTVEYPLGPLPCLLDGTLVRSDPLCITPAPASGAFSLPLIPAAQFILPNARALLRLPQSGPLYLPVPSLGSTRLESYARQG